MEKYEIDVTFDPERGWLSAKATVTLRAVEATESIEFELNPKLAIKEITDAQSRPLAWDRSRIIGSPRLLVRLAEPAAPDKPFTLTFTYEGVPQLTGLDYMNKDGILLRDDARWYPVIDLSAFTQNEMTVALPRNWHAVTTNETKGEKSDGAIKFRFKTTEPVSSRSVLAFPLEPSDQCSILLRSQFKSGEHYYDLPISYCAAAGEEAKREKLAGRLQDILVKYADLLGPRKQFDLAYARGFPGQRGAIGYSAPGFLVVSEDVVKYAGDPTYAPEFLPHEIAHQWFPIEVTLARQEDGWLAESLAEYLAWRYLLEKQPEHARVMVARAMRDSLAQDSLQPLSLGLRLFARDWDTAYTALYQRGMLAWRTLETVIGRSRVDAALREYYKRFAGRSASIADFRKICEEISGRELGWFFDYFIGGTRIPEIELRRVPSTAPNEYAGEIVIKNTPPEFTVRVEMKIFTAQGVVEHSVATRGEVTPFTVGVPGTVTRVVLDPDARILRWTEAARRHRAQRALLARLGELESGAHFSAALELYQQTLAADPDNLAANHQQILFVRGRLLHRMGRFDAALEEFNRVLTATSIDRQLTDFYRAWSYVYRARIFARRALPTAALKETRAGLAIASASLYTEITWPDARRPSTARAELEKIQRQQEDAEKKKKEKGS